ALRPEPRRKRGAREMLLASGSLEKKIAHHGDLVRVLQRRRVPYAADLHHFRARSALCHLGGGLARKEVGQLAADQERRAAHRVVKGPELDALPRHEPRLADTWVVVRAPAAVVVAPQPGLGEEAPLRVAVRAERRRDRADVAVGLLDAR